MNTGSMDPVEPGVKRRRYDASRRRADAARTRARVLDTAERMLHADGYAATTVAAIASAAGVSPELVYKSFGGKAGLVHAIQRRGLLGAGTVAAPDRSDELSASDIDARSLLREWSNLAAEVAPRTAPIMMLIRAAAATDGELVGLLHEMAEQRLQRMAVNAERLTAHAGVRRDLTVEAIRDVMWTYTAPELFDLLVGQRRWTVEAYRDYLFRGLCGQLLQS
jgi:AcrR family transcriptional regulator